MVLRPVLRILDPGLVYYGLGKSRLFAARGGKPECHDGGAKERFDSAPVAPAHASVRVHIQLPFGNPRLDKGLYAFEKPVTGRDVKGKPIR
jgi:hypothetical protein